MALAIAAGVAVGRARVVAVAGAEAVGVGGDDLDVERRDAELARRRARAYSRLLAVGVGGQAEHHLAGRVHAQEHRAVGLVSHSLLLLVVGLGRGARAARAPGGRSARCAPRGRRRPAAARPAGAAAPPAARSPGRCRSSAVVIGHPARRRVAPARAVAAGHRHRAARHRRGAGPRLLLVGLGGAAARRAGASHAPRRSRRRPRRARRSCGRSPARRSAAARRPCRRPAPRTRSRSTRGLTHTIRWASRARRSISRPTSAGSPRSQPSERITTTAPRAMPRRPWRSLNAFSASPIRVPLDQSGAAAAARWIARSGWRAAQRAGQAGQPGGEHERLGVRARCRRRR